LVLDIGRFLPGEDRQQIRVVEIETGKVLARTEVGFNTSLALSPAGDVVSVVDNFRGAGAAPPRPRLTFYQAGDLKRLEGGLLPPTIPRMRYQQAAAADSRLSPTGQELLIPGPDFGGGRAAEQATTVLTCVKQELNPQGMFQPCRQVVRVPRCYGVRIVRVTDWPRVHLFNSMLGLLEVADCDRGMIRSKLYLGDHPSAAGLAPANLEKAGLRLLFQVRGRGSVVTGGGRYAYYLPHGPFERGEEAGYLKKIDLSADPPRIIGKAANPAKDLHPGAAAVCEATGRLFIAEMKPPRNNRHQPSRRVKIYRTKDLSFQGEIELPLNDCGSLTASADGKYVYALNPEEAKLAVLDAATGRARKMLDEIGKYPVIMIAMPTGKAEK
jgi:hypothetical protein